MTYKEYVLSKTNKLVYKGDIVTISINRNNPNLPGYNKPQYIYLLFVWFGGILLGLFIVIKKNQ